MAYARISQVGFQRDTQRCVQSVSLPIDVYIRGPAAGLALRLAPPACGFAQWVYSASPGQPPHTRRRSLCHSSLTFSNRFYGCTPVRTPARRRKAAAVPHRLAQTRRRTLTPCFGTPSRCWRSRRCFCARIAHSGCSACGLTTSTNSRLAVWSDRRGACLETCCVSRARRFRHTGGSHGKAEMEAAANERNGEIEPTT